MKNIDWEGISPALAGLLRGLVHAVILAAVSGAILFLSLPENVPDEYALYASMALAALDVIKRTLEGAYDERREISAASNSLRHSRAAVDADATPEEQPPRASRFALYEDAAGEHRWRLVAPNEQIVAVSGEGYHSPAGAERAVRTVRSAAANAHVETAS